MKPLSPSLLDADCEIENDATELDLTTSAIFCLSPSLCAPCQLGHLPLPRVPHSWIQEQFNWSAWHPPSASQLPLQSGLSHTQKDRSRFSFSSPTFRINYKLLGVAPKVPETKALRPFPASSPTIPYSCLNPQADAMLFHPLGLRTREDHLPGSPLSYPSLKPQTKPNLLLLCEAFPDAPRQTLRHPKLSSGTSPTSLTVLWYRRFSPGESGLLDPRAEHWLAVYLQHPAWAQTQHWSLAISTDAINMNKNSTHSFIICWEGNQTWNLIWAYKTLHKEESVGQRLVTEGGGNWTRTLSAHITLWVQAVSLSTQTPSPHVGIPEE